jgi:gas vesicle protein
MGKTLKKLIVAAGLAALAGYLTGLLTAPKSGKDTREDIKKAAKSGVTEAEKQLKHLVAELGGLLDEAKKRGNGLSDQARKELEELSDKAHLAREKAREVISAVHEGDAADTDLKAAVVQAQSALNHLRDYLKK